MQRFLVYKLANNKILIPLSALQRITVAEIIEDPWFQTEYEHVLPIKHEEKYIAEDAHAAFSLYRVRASKGKKR